VNTTKPKASVGRSLEKNIWMAYLASYSLLPSPLDVSAPPIEPDISKTITALRTLPSRSYPSLDPLVNTVKKLLIPESKALYEF